MKIGKSISCAFAGFFGGLILGYLLWYIAALFMGAGHGSYLPAKLLFPYTMVSTHWTQIISDEAVLCGYLGYAIYGGVLGFSLPNSWTYKVGFSVLSIHILAIAMCIFVASPSF